MKNYNLAEQNENSVTEPATEISPRHFLPAEKVTTNEKTDVNGEEIPEGITFSVLQVLKDNKYSIGTDGKRFIVKGENLNIVK